MHRLINDSCTDPMLRTRARAIATKFMRVCGHSLPPADIIYIRCCAYLRKLPAKVWWLRPACAD